MACGVMAAVGAVMDRPWRWGEADCCTSACDVFLRLYGVDPMRALRGTYANRIEADAVIAEAGGWMAMAERLAAVTGLVSDASPRPGSIGLGDHGLMIKTTRGWAAKSVSGFVLLQGHKCAWSLP